MIPIVVEKTARGERTVDIYSRLLMERTIFLVGPIEMIMATDIVAQIMYLSSQDSSQPINLYIQSGGGSVDAGNAILDCIDLIECPVKTIATGSVASMAAVILSNGTRGLRCSTPRASIMVHQPKSYHISGQATDVEIQAEQLLKTKRDLTELLAKNCGKNYADMLRIMERDYFMTADESIELGIIDDVLKKSV